MQASRDDHDDDRGTDDERTQEDRDPPTPFHPEEEDDSALGSTDQHSDA